MNHSYELRSLGSATRGPDALDTLTSGNTPVANLYAIA
jgi:hypothetical protein